MNVMNLIMVLNGKYELDHQYCIRYFCLLMATVAKGRKVLFSTNINLSPNGGK